MYARGVRSDVWPPIEVFPEQESPKTRAKGNKNITVGRFKMGRSGYHKHNIFFFWPYIPRDVRLIKIICITRFFFLLH